MKLLHSTSHILSKTIILLLLILQLISGASVSVTAQTDFALDYNVLNAEHAIGLSQRLEPIPPHQFEIFSLNMPQLDNREKNILLYLPSEYGKGSTAYPVIYVNETKESLIEYDPMLESWVLNRPLFDFYTKDFSNEVIIVALQNKTNKFWDEYSPWVKEDMYYWVDPYEGNRVEGGEGDAYLDFVVQTLKPIIDSRYRTHPDQANTGIAGAGMGGLISLYAGLTRSEIFSQVAASSPAIWFAENGGPWLSKNRLLSLIETSSVPQSVSFSIEIPSEDRTVNQNFYPVIKDSYGSKISYPQAYLEGTQSFVKSLVTGGLPAANFSGSLSYPGEWTDWLAEASDRETRVTFMMYFPLIMTPPPKPPQITSVPATTFVTGHNNEFTITATGFPAPKITKSATPIDGQLKFFDYSNGTATLEFNNPPIDTVGVYPIKITADNGIDPPAIQYFELRIARPDGLACPTNDSCILNFDMSMTPFLERTRRIWVYLPPNYNTSGLDYQVIYLLDAQHIFGDQADVPLDYPWDWEFDETLDDLFLRSGKGTIAVGVELDADYPWDEYTPWDNNNMDNWMSSPTTLQGEGDNFLHFIVYELKSIVDASYRTLPDRDHTAIGGGSRCGLFSIYAGLRESRNFSKVMAMSPAVWMAEDGPEQPLFYPYWLTTNQLSVWFNTYQAPTNVFHYLYVGTNESGAGGYPKVLKTNGDLLTWSTAYREGADKVKQKYEADGVPYYYRIKLGGTHYPGVWRDYVEEALTKFGFY